MQKSGLVFFLLLAVFMQRCTLEEASIPSERELYIASDYLQAEDSILFEKFARQHGIRIHIEQLDAQVIYQQLHKDGPQSEIDLILLESEFDVHRLAVAELLQPWPKDFTLPGYLEKYTSVRYHFVGFAMDPYVITAAAGSPPIKTYNDLIHHDFSDELSEADRINLLAPISRKMDKGKAETWINAYSAHGKIPSSGRDTIITALPRLMKRSAYYALPRDTSASEKAAMRILTSGKYGSFYNLRTFCIAQQCSNYAEALVFAEYFLKSEKNQFLCEKMHLVPATNPGKTYRPYLISSDELLSYHTLVERILNRLGNQ
jgi:hypothetical protein